MDSEYSLSDSYLSVGGGDSTPAFLDKIATKVVKDHYVAALLVIIVLLLTVGYFLWTKYKTEGFNPSATMRMQQRDGLGERMAGQPDRGSSAFAKQVQTGSGVAVGGSVGPGTQPGTMAWNVLHSDEYGCNKMKETHDDAWTWMNDAAHENMENKPKNDNDFSKILAGQK